MIVTDVKLLKNRRTKIIATLGPASDSSEIIERLVVAGTNVFRLNMSHGDYAYHEKVLGTVRAIADKLQQPVAVLADLCGPKIRVGRFQNGFITLEPGANVTITVRNVLGGDGLIPSQYRDLLNDVNYGDRILLDDGALELTVEQIEDANIICRVIHGGILKDNKGMNLPGVNVSAPALTEKDRHDAQFILKLGIDFLALSFVRRAADITELRAMIEATDASTGIIAKIEKPEALTEMDAIFDATDGIMIARGDLGVELKPEQVPVTQRQLIDRARQRFKPVIVATQMLESMIENARPTRAEVTDIAYAVTLGTDAVMLSAESAIGQFPVESVAMMDRILRHTEAYQWREGGYDAGVKVSNKMPRPVWESMANGVNGLARDLMARAVIVLSQSGMSAATISYARPAAPIIALSNRTDTYRKMALMWGIVPMLTGTDDTSEHDAELAKRVAKQLTLGQAGDSVLLVKGFHGDATLNRPSVMIVTL